MIELKLSNIVENYDEFISRLKTISLKNKFKNWIKNDGTISLLPVISYCLKNFIKISYVFDYDKEYKLNLCESLKSKTNQKIFFDKMFEDNIYLKYNDKSLLNIVDDPNLGYSQNKIDEAKLKFISEAYNKNLYHVSKIENYENIKLLGLKNKFNYLCLDYIDESYSLNEEDEEISNVVVSVKVSDVKNRFYPDPESFDRSCQYAGYVGYMIAEKVNLDLLFLFYYLYDGLSWCFVIGEILPELLEIKTNII